MVDGAGFAVRTFSAAFDRVSVLWSADVVTVVIVTVGGGGFVAWNVAFCDELLHRNCLLFAIHVSCYENRNQSEFGLDDFCFSHHEPYLGSSGHCAAWLYVVSLPPEVCVDKSECKGQADEFSFFFIGENAKKVIKVFAFDINEERKIVVNESEGFIVGEWLDFERAKNTLTHDDAKTALDNAIKLIKEK